MVFACQTATRNGNQKRQPEAAKCSERGGDLLPLDELEKRYIARVLETTGYNKGLTAQILDILRTTLWRKPKEYKLG